MSAGGAAVLLLHAIALGLIIHRRLHDICTSALKIMLIMQPLSPRFFLSCSVLLSLYPSRACILLYWIVNHVSAGFSNVLLQYTKEDQQGGRSASTVLLGRFKSVESLSSTRPIKSTPADATFEAYYAACESARNLLCSRTPLPRYKRLPPNRTSGVRSARYQGMTYGSAQPAMSNSVHSPYR